MTVKATPNPNINVLGGMSPHDVNNARYREYRRKWVENPQGFIVEDFPVHLDIEATNRCNLKCTFCDKLPYLKPEDFGDIELDLFKKIIIEGQQYGLSSIKLSYRGEPLLHQQLPEMIQFARDHGVLDIYFNTNAMLLTEKKAQQLIEAGLPRISISMEGVDPKAFEEARIGARFEVVRRNVARLKNLREQLNVDYPQIRLQTVALPGIDLEEYSRFWSPYCDETAAIDYKEAETVMRAEDLVCENWACPQLWQRMTIEWDGRIMPCNNDDYRKISPGNVHDMTVKECWKAAIVEQARELHVKGQSHLVEACNGCPWRTTQITKVKCS